MDIFETGLTVTRPGKGSPKEDCMAELPKICLDCGKYYLGKHYCMSRTCPNCYTKRAYRDAFRAANNILYNRHSRSIVHAVLSIKGHPDEIFDNFERVYKILSDHHVIAGLCIPHYERHGKIDGYLHYHIVGYLKDRYIPGGAGLEYVFKVIGFINDRYQLPGVIGYLLTHCAMKPGVHSTRYFGERFEKPALEFFKSISNGCEFCGSGNVYNFPLIDYTGGSRCATEVKLNFDRG